MPFTFSHPAVILPFSYLPKKYVSFSGLVIGSMIPDLEYFFRFRAQSYYSHTWAGLFWFDLPFAIIVCFLFHNVVRDILIQNLPAPAAARCIHCFGFNWNRWFRQRWPVIIICIIVGVISHLIWDRLIHETTETLEQTNYIQRKDIPAKGVVVYYSYWGLNSVLGIVALLAGFWKMPMAKIQTAFSLHKIYWPLISIISLTVLLLRLLVHHDLVFADLVDSAIASFLIALVVTSLMLKFSGKTLADMDSDY